MKNLEQYRLHFEDALAKLGIDGEPDSLYEPVRYILGLGGKRLRPALVLASCEYFSGKLEDAIMPALGIEMFHNFTLLHDDIMDKAPLRRGHPTVHMKWDINRAILSGDTLFAMAGKQMLQTRPEAIPSIQHLFFQTAIEVCEGQQMDMDFETRADVTTGSYLQMIGLKTAVLIAACLKTGALIANAPPHLADALYDFGYRAGLAFQLQDDYLDVFGDAEAFGKASGGDIEANKKTWLYLRALELADVTSRQTLTHLYKTASGDERNKVQMVKEIFIRLGIPGEIRALMSDYHDKAIKALHEVEVAFGEAPLFRSFAAQVIERQT